MTTPTKQKTLFKSAQGSAELFKGGKFVRTESLMSNTFESRIGEGSLTTDSNAKKALEATTTRLKNQGYEIENISISKITTLGG